MITQKKKKIQDGENGEEGTANDDTRVGVIETSTGRTLTGDEAPLMSQLSAFLEQHPGWEPIESESEDDDDDEDENGESDKSESKFLVFLYTQICSFKKNSNLQIISLR